jgi:hypothetical protein
MSLMPKLLSGATLQKQKMSESQYPEILREIRKKGGKALIYASQSGYVEIVRFALDIKRNIEVKPSLYAAAENGHLDAARRRT